MRNYVTLFNRDYLAKGLALYQSLQAHSSKDFTLYVLALDDFTRKYLEYEAGKNVLSKMVILDWSFMPRDIPVKPVPYNFFLLASEVTLALMKHLRKPVTYLDSDIYFFDDPEKIYVSIGSKEVAIIPHRFPSHDFARLSPNGLYNVSFVYFANTQKGIETLLWWRDSCRAKCDAESCGDQLYLNEFPKRLGDKLCVLENIGIGAGPWNTYEYNVTDGPKVNGEDLIFYHFHEFKDTKDGYYHYTGYPVTAMEVKYVYEPYMQIIKYCQDHIDKKAGDWFAN